MQRNALRSLLLSVLTVVGLAHSVTSAQAALPPTVTGVLDSGNWDGSLYTVRGWAVNGAVPGQSVEIHAYDTGPGGTIGRPGFRADQSRPDVGRAFGLGDQHGFAFSFPLTPGAHRICLYGIDTRPGSSNSAIGCRDVTVGAGAPVGVVDVFGEGGNTFYINGTMRISGWTYDPNQRQTPLDVHVYNTAESGGPSTGAAFTSSVARPDVAAAFPGVGPTQGFDIAVPVGQTRGRRVICVYAIGVGGGGNALIGCRTVFVLPAQPDPTAGYLGVLDSVQATGIGQITYGGWALDTASPQSSVTVSLTGIAGPLAPRTVTADQLRPDIGAAFPGAGDAHGLRGSVITYPGVNQDVCIQAGQRVLACRTVHVFNAYCELTTVTQADGVLTITAYVHDPFHPGTSVPVVVWLKKDSGEVVASTTASPTSESLWVQMPSSALTPGEIYTVQLEPQVLRPLQGGDRPGSTCVTGTFRAA